MSKICLIYTTFENGNQAREVIRELIEKGYATCANIFPMESQYLWKDSYCDQSEVGVLLKTSLTKETILMQKIEECHPYELPCILSWQVDASQRYGDWINLIP